MIEATNKAAQFSTPSNPNHPKQKVWAVAFFFVFLSFDREHCHHEDPKDPCSPSSTMIALAVCPGRLNSANLELELGDSEYECFFLTFSLFLNHHLVVSRVN